METRVGLAGVIVVVLCASSLQAHHSIAGMYDQGRRVTVDGVVAEFHNVNPHPFVLIDVSRDGGSPERWKVELDNRGELAAVGVTNETWKPGDRVIVSGSPGRADSKTMYVWKMERPSDGLVYEQIGTSPRISGLRK